MIVDRFEPINLSELIPELRLEMEPSLQALDRLLDDDEIFLRIGADTLECLNERVVVLAFERKLTRARKLRTDVTVVETNICHPTHNGLLNDG